MQYSCIIMTYTLCWTSASRANDD